MTLATLIGCAEAAPPRTLDTEIAVRVDRVVVDHHDTPVVVLEETNGLRWLPIWIGSAEAQSIALQIARHPAFRPNSHDLAHNLIHELRGRVARVVITELRGGTFYASLDVLVDGTHVILDARPSDAIAIALRDDAPVFVRAELFEQHGRPPAPEKTSAERRI